MSHSKVWRTLVSIEILKTPKYHIFSKKIILSIILSKCGNEDERIFKEEESIEILKILGLIKDRYVNFKNMSKENISVEFRLEEIDEERNYF